MPRSRYLALAACGTLLTIFAVASMHSWWYRYCSYDEPLHLVSAFAQNQTRDFRCNPEDPPLWKYYAIAGISSDRLRVNTSTPLWDELLGSPKNSEFVSDTLFATPGNDPDGVLRAARLHMVVLGILLGVLIAWWAWRLAGPLAGVVAAAGFCLDPNFLAHSALVKNDVPITLLFTALMAMTWLLGERVTGWRCLAVGLLLSMAITTKFSGLLGIPMLGLALLARVLGPTPWPVFRFVVAGRFYRLVVAAGIGLFSVLLAWGFVWAIYDFRFSIGPNPNTVTELNDVLSVCVDCETIANHNLPWDMTLNQLQNAMQDWQPSTTITASRWVNSNRLLPQTFIRGFLYTYATTLYRGAFLCGDLSLHGWWYYFPLAMLFKTPLATLIALAVGGASWIWARRNIFRSPKAISCGWWPFCAAAVTPVFYMIMALRSHTDLGLRHIFPVYPYLFIFLGVAAADAYSRRPRIATCLIALLGLGLAAETFCASPDFLSFFNVAAGGERGGAALLGDSNLDWGQDLNALVQWRKDHPDGQLCLSYFGTADPRYYGLHYYNLPGDAAPDDQPPRNDGSHIYAISVTYLQGLYMTTRQHEQYLQFRDRKIAAILGGTIYVYSVP
ncbi:MAG: hypothetical protein ABSF29_05180 [Tepidisphaeraceae bacterium]|jgi:hypothetical protein